MRHSRIVLVLGLGLLAAHMFYFYPHLPPTLATHFDAAGAPNGWMEKSSFAIFEEPLLLVILGQFILIPFWGGRLPVSFLNLPNKDYWLADERRDETFAKMATAFEWLGVLVVLLFITLNHFTFHANIHRTGLSGYSWIVIVVFLVCVALWVLKFCRQFRIPK